MLVFIRLFTGARPRRRRHEEKRVAKAPEQYTILYYTRL